jgi:hypothetical protein
MPTAIACVDGMNFAVIALDRTWIRLFFSRAQCLGARLGSTGIFAPA